ncbi:MAG: YbaB/EbfC family nucleoid-associated protein [Candidatus Nomurabacteria bacterium]|jgi:DNA-binding YbaB/EbfC family protein|nr:YbaB/EbfC family nucleoid-associated protein [Candidatus Nomurabacteria bacterium]
MAGMGSQMKMLNQMRKVQKELAREIVEVEAGDGAVVIQFNGEMKVVSVKLDASKIDLDDISELEAWLQAAIRDGLKEAQDMAAEKMKPLMGGLGNLGL